jgi:hypothetical protein
MLNWKRSIAILIGIFLTMSFLYTKAYVSALVTASAFALMVTGLDSATYEKKKRMLLYGALLLLVAPFLAITF